MGRSINLTILTDSGDVIAWGNNQYGQCGTGNTTSPQLSPYTIPGLSGVKQVFGGYAFNAFLMSDGTVKTVGSNNNGQCGTGNTTSPQLSLYTIPNLTGVKQVACGNEHIVFLMSDGTVKTAGNNNLGQCGTGNTTTPQLSLYTIPGLSGVKQVVCGQYHTVFIMLDGTVKTIGSNGAGQCGTGVSSTSQLSLYTIPGLSGVKQAACGNSHTVFLMSDGTVKTVGNNTEGQCGTGNTTTPQLSLYTIPGLSGVKQVACGAHHSVFLMNDGVVKVVGNNYYGQCGTGNTTNPQLSLYTVPGLTGVKQISSGTYVTAYLMVDGTVKTVGHNSDGQCGTGNTTTPQLSLYTIPNITVSNLTDIPLEIALYLLKVGTSCYTFKPFKELVTASAPTEGDFTSSGFEDITLVNNTNVSGEVAFEKDLTWAGGGNLYRKAFNPSEFTSLKITSIK